MFRRMSALTTVGRVIYALPFAIFGISHFLEGKQMVGSVPVPGGVFWIYFTGAAMVAASIGIITKILGKWASLGLALLLLLFVLFVHIPGLSNPAMRPLHIMSLLKDTALLGAALTIAGLFIADEAEKKHRVAAPHPIGATP